MLLENPLVAGGALVAVDMLFGVDETLVSVDDLLDAVGALSGVDDMVVTVDAAVVDGIEEAGLIDEELGNAAVDEDVWRIDRLEVCDDRDEDIVCVLRLDEVKRVDEVKTVDDVKRLGDVKVIDRLSVVRPELLLL
ncbi:hypothetical protein FJTKL_08714 [Diaporthe vaccinii]|uniref:Uncharacterized protein n=1 Tax=Diaporthe vaccinii TaxID=105482 RepID=A0ABR4ER27_9PEZI